MRFLESELKKRVLRSIIVRVKSDRVAHASRVLVLASRQNDLCLGVACARSPRCRRRQRRQTRRVRYPVWCSGATAPAPSRTQKFTCTLLSCCSVGHGAFNGTSGTASLGCTRPFSIRYCSTSSPLTSGNILSLISTQGESGCPLFVSISQRNAGLAMISFSMCGRLYLLSTARTPALQPQYVFR